MNRHINKIIILLLLALVPAFSHAQVVINEILYSPTADQWVEVYNRTDSEINLADYKILDNGASANGHSIVECSGVLGPGSYGIVAKVPGNFFDSTFSICRSALGIRVSEDTVVFKLGTDIIDTVSIDGFATGGKSIQRQSDGT